MIVCDAKGQPILGPDGRVQVVKTDLYDLQIDEFSAVDVPAHEGALAAITKSERILTAEPSKETPTMPPDNDLANVQAALTKALADVNALTAQVGTLTAERDTATALVAKVAALPDDHRAHYSTLSATDGPAIVAKSFGDRAAIVKAAQDADPVEVVVVLPDGSKQEVRKSAGPVTIGMAKANVMLAEKIAKQEQEAALVRLDKRATAELGAITGEQAGRVALLRAVDLLPEADRPAATAVLKACNEAFTKVFKNQGSSFNPSPDDTAGGGDAAGRLESMAKRYAAEHKVDYFAALDTLTDPQNLGTIPGVREALDLMRESSPGNRR